MPREPRPIAPRIVVHAVEGFGETTLGAFAPNPAILMSRGETGYDTMLSSSLVPSVPAEEITRWDDLLLRLTQLAHDSQERKTIVVDTIGGMERLCHEQVCRRDFGGDWTEKGFAAYQKGYDLAVTDWLDVLGRLDHLNRRGITTLLLCHSHVTTFKNPLGPDFDRYSVDLHPKTWGVTHRWADAILFGNFLTIIDDEKRAKRRGKGKGIGGTDRVLHAERRDAFDAKNRFGMDSEIWLDGGPSAAWTTLWSALTRRKDQTHV